MRSALADGIRLLLAVVWLYAAFSKARDSAGVRAVIGSVIPPRWHSLTRAMPGMLIVIETLLGAALLVGWHEHLAAGISAGLFGVFALAIGAASLRAALPQGGCGCFGTASQTSDVPIDDIAARAIARNIALVALAFIATTQP